MTAGTEPSAARILVVDDMPANVRLLEAVLQPAGFSVTSASSGPEALERVVSELPDLVLLDVQMAGMNGYEVCRRIRENEETALIPVVMITSHDNEARIDGIRAGADDFVTKPFDHQELLLRARSLVRIKRYHDTIRAQAAQLSELNRTLEARVAEQVEELGRMARLRRFL
jgi:CheY-like chemotaxis protein